jgi:hypothetical protein
MIWFSATFWPFATIGFWLRQVRSFRPSNLRSTYSSVSSSTIRSASTNVTVPASRARTTMPLFSATARSMPVPTSGGSQTLQQRHRLPLHVRAHQGAVGVVVLEERNQRSGDANGLLRRDVDVADLVSLPTCVSRREPGQSWGPPPGDLAPRSIASGGARMCRISSSARSNSTPPLTFPPFDTLR